jgi:hypothetical protein
MKPLFRPLLDHHDRGISHKDICCTGENSKFSLPHRFSYCPHYLVFPTSQCGFTAGRRRGVAASESHNRHTNSDETFRAEGIDEKIVTKVSQAWGCLHDGLRHIKHSWAVRECVTIHMTV